MSLLIAKDKKAHSIFESIIKFPTCSVEKIVWPKGYQKIISLSNNTVKRRIDDMAVDLREELMA